VTAPLVAVVGPTAVGKTALALRIARRWNAEIVGVDASQVYRGLDIGTGKVSPRELEGVVHHLVDVVEPAAPFDAAQFAALADAAIADAHARGRRVVLCGGTGLYLRALVDGLSAVPPVPEALRASLRARLERGEVEAMHRELQHLDPTTGARLSARDGQRIERALGVALATGRPLSAWHADTRDRPPRYAVRVLGLTCPRETLDARIETRVGRMFEAGWVDEVRGLLAAGLPPDARSLKALGYAQILELLAGRCDEAQARALTVLRTRQYARRQETWFKALPGVTWWTPPVADTQLDAYLAALS
jgi:tRNA dimethylallyltransferase